MRALVNNGQLHLGKRTRARIRKLTELRGSRYRVRGGIGAANVRNFAV